MQAVASVAGVDVASVVIASTTEMRAQREEHANDEEQGMHTRVSLRQSGSLVVGMLAQKYQKLSQLLVQKHKY